VPGVGDVPGTKGCLNSFALLKKKYTKLRVVLSVGGGGKGSEPFAAVACDPAARERFAQTSKALVQQFGIDGIDSMLARILISFQTIFLTVRQLTGNTPRTQSRGKTILRCWLHCERIFLPRSIHSLQPFLLVNGLFNT